MSKQYFCDVCGRELDKVISIQDRKGEINIYTEGTNLSINIILNLIAAGYNDICFNCIISGMQEMTLKREEELNNVDHAAR